jgi:diacylglycerol kinase family enzyme
VISLTFASTRKYGTGALINPTGTIDDGLFELIMIRSFPWYSLPSLFVRFFTGKIHESIYSDIISCSSAEVKLRKRKMLQVDGELIGKVQQINVSIVPQGLRILIP